MNLWSFRFILWYICILLVQPQNRFTFLWPLRIANLAFIIGVGLHILACLEERRPIVRLGPATILALALMFFATLSQYFGVYQKSPDVYKRQAGTFSRCGAHVRADCFPPKRATRGSIPVHWMMRVWIGV